MISSVKADGPAGKAGIMRGDVIVEYNGHPVADSDSLVALVVATKPGTTVPITILPRQPAEVAEHHAGRARFSKRRRRRQAGDRTSPDAQPEPPTATDFGMQLEAIDPEIARGAELPRGRGGAIVTDVDRGSAAARAGVQPNDIILEVNRQPMTSLTQVTKALQNATAGTPVFLVVWRDGQELFITMSKR